MGGIQNKMDIGEMQRRPDLHSKTQHAFIRLPHSATILARDLIAQIPAKDMMHKCCLHTAAQRRVRGATTCTTICSNSCSTTAEQRSCSPTATAKEHS
jgi:hypothetical protein